jgi:hypothetical protein
LIRRSAEDRERGANSAQVRAALGFFDNVFSSLAGSVFQTSEANGGASGNVVVEHERHACSSTRPTSDVEPVGRVFVNCHVLTMT